MCVRLALVKRQPTHLQTYDTPALFNQAHSTPVTVSKRLKTEIKEELE